MAACMYARINEYTNFPQLYTRTQTTIRVRILLAVQRQNPIAHHTHTKPSQIGFGFVTYENNDPVEKVLSQSLQLDGRKLDIKLAVSKDEMATQHQSVVRSSKSIHTRASHKHACART